MANKRIGGATAVVSRAFGVQQRDALGHQLAEDQRDEGYDQDHHDGGDVVGELDGRPQAGTSWSASGSENTLVL